MEVSAVLIDKGIDGVRRKIIDAVDQPLARLTVNDICQKAGISKQTFYSRFSSKYDIPNWFCAYHEKIFLYEIGRTLSWEDGLGGLFGAYENRRDFLYFTSIQTRDTGSETKARHRMVLKETLERYRGIPVTHDVKFLIEAFLELEVFLAGEWFRSGMSPCGDVFTKLFIDCVPARLYSMLQIENRPSTRQDEHDNDLFARYYP